MVRDIWDFVPEPFAVIGLIHRISPITAKSSALVFLEDTLFSLGRKNKNGGWRPDKANLGAAQAIKNVQVISQGKDS